MRSIFTTEKKIKHKIHFNSKNSDLKIRKEKKKPERTYCIEKK